MVCRSLSGRGGAEHTLVGSVGCGQEGGRGLEVFIALIYFCYSVCLNIVKINARAEAEASFRFGHRDTNVPPPARRAGGGGAGSRKPTLFPLFIHLCDTPPPLYPTPPPSTISGRRPSFALDHLM